MRIALTTLGSTGDVQPFLALACRLQQRGHVVRLCTHPMFKAKVEAQGIEFYPTAPDMTVAWLNEQVRVWVETKNLLSSMAHLIENVLFLDAVQRFKDCMNGLRGFDLVICHHADFPGQEAALRLGIPWVSTVLSPEPIPTAHSVPWPFARVSLGRMLNRLLWRGAEKAIRNATRKPLTALQSAVQSSRDAELGLVPMSPHLNLMAASSRIGIVEADFPEDFVLTGNWFLDEASGFVPSDELRRFVEAGPPPVVVSFGSMGAGDGAKVSAIVADAIRQTGQRAIVQKGWGDLNIGGDERFLAVDYVPHSYLFSHASCVVHHGGAGTTAAACLAGKPSVVVPHGADQYYWARSLRWHGVAPRMLAKWFFTAPRLAWRLNEVLSDPGYQQRARALGEHLRAEDGVGAAVAAIEKLQSKLKVA